MPLTPEAGAKLDAFFRLVAGSTAPLLLLDYDGTLAAFRVNRYTARPWAGVRELLTRIQREGRTRMAVITGRPAAEIAPLLGLEPALEVWGLHGAERLYPDGRRELDLGSDAAQQRLEELRVLLHRDALGGLFEDKPNAAVMHWRGASAAGARAIEVKTRALFEPLAEVDGLRLQEFEAGIELRVGRDKGGAVAAIVAEGDADAPVAFLGDDWTDEAGFRAVNAVGARGLSVLMRHSLRQTEAQVWLRPPAEMRAFLTMWARAVDG